MILSYIKEFVADLTYTLTIKPHIDTLKGHFLDAKVFPAGSRYVCMPPKFFTDIDFLIYSEEPIMEELFALGYKEGPWKDYGFTDTRPIKTLRKGKVNLIVTDSAKYANTFNTATHICRSFNVRKKFHRIVVHEALRNEWKKEDFPTGLKDEIRDILIGMLGPYGAALIKAYMFRNNMEVISNGKKPSIG